MDSLLHRCFFFSLCFIFVAAGPQFCIRGFQLASKFHKCWEQATYSHKYAPLHEPHEFLDAKFFEAYATHMCSVVKPEALACLQENVRMCSNAKKIMAIADNSGGACRGNKLNPFFKNNVIDHLVAVKSNSPCFDLADNSYECYPSAGQKVKNMGSQSENIVTFHKVADTFFNAYWDCMVEIYKSNIKICPHWQIPMLLTLQNTAMPSLFGLRLQPEQVKKLELSNVTIGEEGKGSNLGPSNLYLLLQLHKTLPEVGENDEDSLVVEIADLNEENPRIELESEGEGRKEPSPHTLTLKEIKKLMRDQRRRNKELKEFINQAKGLAKKRESGKTKTKKTKKINKKLHQDSMIN